MLCLHIIICGGWMRQHLTNILIWGTHSDVVKGKIDHWLDSFEDFHQEYIIMPTIYSNYSVPEESKSIEVMIHPGFIN